MRRHLRSDIKERDGHTHHTGEQSVVQGPGATEAADNVGNVVNNEIDNQEDTDQDAVASKVVGDGLSVAVFSIRGPASQPNVGGDLASLHKDVQQNTEDGVIDGAIDKLNIEMCG